MTSSVAGHACLVLGTCITLKEQETEKAQIWTHTYSPAKERQGTQA
jgi:hypothetical protein